MSAAFKNAKKKLSQSELRKFMNEHKSKTQVPQKKIDSPLAKYTESGQLTCVLCQSVVRSENVWTVHINSKAHKENIEKAKKLKERTNNFSTTPKRPATPPMEIPNKKVKGILKNAKSTINAAENKTVEKESTEIKSSSQKGENILEKNGLPTDFFDREPVKKTTLVTKSEEIKEAGASVEILPEGFFDDPKLDAKARNIDYKDPVEEEWEKFQKEIREADHESAAIIAEDQEEATTERQIDEIDEQMRNWSRVLNLERKKVEIMSTVSKPDNQMDVDESSSDVDDNFDEYLDWRSKKAFK